MCTAFAGASPHARQSTLHACWDRGHRGSLPCSAKCEARRRCAGWRAGESARAHEYSRQAKSQWRPSSREMSSLEKVRPCMRPRFLSQKMLQKEPLKKMPSTQPHATSRVANEVSLHGTVHTPQHSQTISTYQFLISLSLGEHGGQWVHLLLESPLPLRCSHDMKRNLWGGGQEAWWHRRVITCRPT